MVICPSKKLHKTESLPKSTTCWRTRRVLGTGLDNLSSRKISPWGSSKETFPVEWCGFALRYCSLTMHRSVGFLQKWSMILPWLGSLISCHICSLTYSLFPVLILSTGGPLLRASLAATGESSDDSDLTCPWDSRLPTHGSFVDKLLFLWKKCISSQTQQLLRQSTQESSQALMPCSSSSHLHRLNFSCL